MLRLHHLRSPPLLLSLLLAFLTQTLQPARGMAIDTADERCKQGHKFAYDFSDCTSYYVCVYNRAVLMHCPADLIFSMSLQVCTYREDFSAGCTVATLPPNLEAAAELTTFMPEVGFLTETPAVPRAAFLTLRARCLGGAIKLAHSQMCERYYDCSSVSVDNNMDPFMFICPFPTVFDDVTSTCVQNAQCGSRTTMTEPWKLSDLCTAETQILPHPDDCHRFLDCGGYIYDRSTQSGSRPQPGTLTDRVVNTCAYPDLFSVTTGRCEPFDNVVCGDRKEAVTPCEYQQAPQACLDPLYASCEGWSDGAHVYRTREGSPYYVVCRSQRTVDKLICPLDGRGIYQQFSPMDNKCRDVISLLPVA